MAQSRTPRPDAAMERSGKRLHHTLPETLARLEGAGAWGPRPRRTGPER